MYLQRWQAEEDDGIEDELTARDPIPTFSIGLFFHEGECPGGEDADWGSRTRCCLDRGRANALIGLLWDWLNESSNQRRRTICRSGAAGQETAIQDQAKPQQQVLLEVRIASLVVGCYLC